MAESVLVIMVVVVFIVVIAAVAIGAYCWRDYLSNILCSSKKKKSHSNRPRIAHTTSIRGNFVKTYRTDIHADYVIDRDQELGKGGCGVVVIGTDKGTGTEYAVKVVNKNSSERGRLDRELKLLKDVDHTNIVRLFSVYDSANHMYFVMELCKGGHLGNLLSRQPRKHADEAWGKRLCRQILSAVAHIHGRGIAHRDIKLQNILVDVDNDDRAAQLKLIDFGYGSRYAGNLPMKTKCGTPYTTAPEVIRQCYDERCDVWSVGVVLYIILSGRRPFEVFHVQGQLPDAGKAAMISNILAGRYHFNHKAWQSVSPEAIKFVKMLLNPDYTSRIRSHDALVHSWMNDETIADDNSLMLASNKSHIAVANMKRSYEFSELQRAGMLAMVFGLQPKAANDMAAVFQSIDTDASGMLSRLEFTRAMNRIAPELTAVDIERLFNLVDYDKDNQISYTEFLAATLDPRDVDVDELNRAFRLFDEDGDGHITKEEMKRVKSPRQPA